jgi:hypothetical protein
MRNRMMGHISVDLTASDPQSQANKRGLWHQLTPDERAGLAVLLCLLLFALLASALAILRESGVVPPWPMDQSFAQVADLRIGRENGSWVFHYPNLQNSGGITSVLIAGIYKLIVPTTASNLNWHIRILAMAGYLISSACLILVYLRHSSVRLISFVLVAVSGYQFVQPSSELFAATLLCFFLVCAVQRSSVWLASLLLVGYGFCKVELILSSMILAGYWMWSERRDPKRRLLIPLSYVTWFGALLLPSIRLNGIQTLSGSRSWEAFKVKYTSLFHPHQLSAPSEDPWDYSHQTIDKIFPDSDHKIINVIRKYPRMYLDYLALAFTQSLLNILGGIKLLVIPAAICLTAPRISTERLRFATGALLIMILFGLIPAAFMGFVHVRYVMRYYPLIVVVLLGLCLDSKQERAWVQPLVWVAAIATLILQIIFLPEVVQQSHFL